MTYFKMVTYSKLRPVVAGYKMESANFLSGLMTKTARQVKGIPEASFSTGSNIPSCVAKTRFSSAIIGKGKLSPIISP